MKKKFIAIAALVLLLLGSSVAGYAYWDNLTQSTNNEFNIGYGVRLQTPVTSQDDRALVPAGSFYSAYEGEYTTSYEFTYVLSLEDPLQDNMTADLTVDLTDFAVNAVSYLFNDSASVFTIAVGTDEAEAYVSETGVWDFADAFYYQNNTVTVNVTITLADNGDANFDATDYNAIAGFATTFTLGFELTNSNSSTQA